MSPLRQPADAISQVDGFPADISSGGASQDGETLGAGHQIPKEGGAVKKSQGHASSAPVHTKDTELQDNSMPQGVELSSNEVGGQPVVVGGITAEATEAKTAHTHDPMESSTATLKPDNTASKQATAQTLSPDDKTYLDPTPKTPRSSQPPSRTGSSATSISISQQAGNPEAPERSPTRSDAGFDEKPSTSDDERELSSTFEIQSIMDQFGEEGQGPDHEEVMSPRLEIAGPLLGSPIQHPPRKSSLEPLNSPAASATQSMQDLRLASNTPHGHQGRDPSDVGPSVPPKPGSIHSFGPPRRTDDRQQSLDSPMSPPLHRPPPPEPEPEPDLPFDFHRFLEQLKHRSADPVAKFLRSFLQEFGKKQWMVHEQVKIIGDFLAFITPKMAQCDVWREVSDAEFDNAREGMEKLVMNRLYSQTFSPAIPPPQPIPGAKPRRRGAERPMGPGRRGQHQEDVERDDILAQKVSIYGWIKEEHLDIQPIGESGKRFLILAQQELLKIKTYRAPRDKIICVLNCCKVIFGLLKHAKSDGSADSFMPLLIYTVLRANPEHLVSNVQYILRFRNQEKLGGEAGYYLSSLSGAIQFVENLDRTTLTISDEEFEQNVEAAVSAIAEKHQAALPEPPLPTQLSEKSGLSRPEVTPRHSMEGESSAPRKSTSSNEYSGDDEKAAMSGLLRTIQRPLSSIGRIFSEDGPSQAGPARTPLPGNTPRMSPDPRAVTDPRQGLPQPPGLHPNNHIRARMSAEDAAARQASAETAEVHRMQRAEHENVVQTLAGMFPDLDRELISDVVTQKDGRVALAVDACLALGA
ncbi:Vacuolar protein sorting-associated protein 9a [Lachnellula arida]|uniref:Vacuolar protein sorting-associated protein 9a n=1 Tax=Lachnellula arida TaxID=1316785 RepID=A0A8T9BGH6_9HELO|nr:Vacuolar protein sorting-associated protein 9a [Lachnellula arida]